MDVQANKDNYFDTDSLAKPPRFDKDNFFHWKNRMKLFLSGSDAQIPNFMENGPHVPATLVVAIPATATTTIIKNVTQWTDEDKRLVNIDTKARSLLFMSVHVNVR